ncbi:MAG: PVC-type heme-binding CxxCH protein [Gemmataceae bacterium]
MLRLHQLILVLMAILTHGVMILSATANDEGIRPVDASGRPLNLDFESGTLKDWEPKGQAFEGQPVKGDTVATRRGDMRSRHQGQFWIGTFERLGDKPQGSLTSTQFKITHRWASFLIGGGPHQSTAVELVLKENDKIIYRFSGNEEEDLRRELVDLNPHLGKEMFIRLVDKHSGHWGHLNFDDFRFHSVRPNFPDRPRNLQSDFYKFAGLSPEKSARAMTVPPGFNVTLFAGEPDVNQPIAMCLDDRGRVWIAEAYSYPIRRIEKEARDRIVIFEDTNGDGVFDKRTVFMDKLNLVSGLELGFGGVWIGAAPHLLFVPVTPGEDKPSGPAQVLLDGWGYQDTHETLNTFTWGPDGWLYGCHGVFTHSKVGKPGTPDALRTLINAGVWRYHPTKHEFEVFAHGTSNPWGLDFNDWGQAFVEACVIPHNWHIIHNARYQRQAGSHFNPYTFDDIKTIAVHRHYLGPTPHSGNEKSDSAGGGHAHCGTMIYLGGTWPSKYRNQMFMGNIHGRRLNVDSLSPKGSGWVANRSPDFLLANDAWARFINLQIGPDGNAFLIDWYDKQACHHGDPKIWDRESGRIYKICYGDSKAAPTDLRLKTNKELANLQNHQNDWFVRHARRILQERKAEDVLPDLEKIAFDHLEETRRLRGLWAIHAIGGMNEERILRALNDSGAFVRGWAIQLACESKKVSKKTIDKFERLAKEDPSPVVRLYLASNLQRLPLDKRWTVLSELVQHGEDSNDHNLPLMYWYAMEPLAEIAPERGSTLHLNPRSQSILATWFDASA